MKSKYLRTEELPDTIPKELSKMLATKKFAKILPVDADEFVVKVV